MCAMLLLMWAGPAKAQPVVTSPLPNQVFGAGPDFATDVLQDPWDFNNAADLTPDPDQMFGWAPAQMQLGRVNGVGAAFLTSAGGNGLFRGFGDGTLADNQVTLLYRGDAEAINTVRSGMEHGIPASRFRKIAFKMRVLGATQLAQPVVYFYHTPYLPGNAHINRGGGVLMSDNVPAGDSPYQVFVVDLDSVRSTGGSPRLVPACAPGVGGCTGVPQYWSQESLVAGLRIDPTGAGMSQVDLDWVRLTTSDASAEANMTVTYGACAGSATLVVRDADSVDTIVGAGSATSGTFNYGIFPPGPYSLLVTCQNGTGVVPFFINTPPQVTVVDPDRTGDPSTDYQSTVARPGDPWDFQQPSDVAVLRNASVTSGACAAGGCGLVPSTRPGAPAGSLMLRASSAGAGPAALGDPIVELVAGSTNPVSSRRQRLLTFSLNLNRAYDVALGSVARVLWGSQNFSDQSVTTTSQDIRVWPGFQTYTVDLGALTVANGGIETECTVHNPPCLTTPWNTRSIRFFRLDPLEFMDQPTLFDMDDVLLTAPDEVNLSGAGHPRGTFTIRYALADPDPGAAYTTTIYLDTDRNRDNGVALTAAASLASQLGANQYAWTPPAGLPVGSYWIYVENTETRDGISQTQGAYSSGPLVVYSESVSSPQVTVSTPAPNTQVPFPFSIQGCAYDQGNAAGINMDDLAVFAIATQVPNRTPGETFALGFGGSLGTLQYAPLTPASPVVCDAIANPASPFRHAGFRVSDVYLDTGVWSIRVMARSTLSNRLEPLGADIPVTVSQLTLAPVNFQATASGNTVTVSFQAPTGGPPIGGYVIDGATDPSFNPAFNVIVPSAGTYSGVLGNGGYYLRVVSLSPLGSRGGASATRFVQVGPLPLQPPGPPTLVLAQVSVNPVTLSWAPGPGGAPTGYVLLAGTQPGAQDLGAFPMGSATSITAVAPLGVPLYVHVVASNAAGSATSNEVTFQLSAPVAPGPPTLSPASVSGGNVTLTWAPPTIGGPPTGYLIRARYSPTGPVIATLPATGSAITVPAPPGTYYVDILASNSAGFGPPSNTITVVVP
jgi:hypothetical protein